jgi:hypothetical protein
MALPNNNETSGMDQSFFDLDSIPGIDQIDNKSQQGLEAISELSETYLYACVCVETTTHFSQLIQELKKEEPCDDPTAYFQICYQKYLHDIEEILIDMSRSLITINQQDLFLNFLAIAASEIESIFKFIKDKGKKIYDYLVTYWN